MPRVRIVVTDSEKAREAQIQAYERGFHDTANALERVDPESARRLRATARKKAEHHAPKSPPPVGFVWTEMDTECPGGGENCRNCGDPAHTQMCRAAGHCPYCGTRHGVTYDAQLLASGLALEEA